MLAIVGESGTGKSTLLHILGTLDRPSAGDVYFAHLRLSTLSEDAAADFRNREIGFVWQFHYLLPEFTALENVAMPLLVRGVPKPEAEKKALRWLEEVGLKQRAPRSAGDSDRVVGSIRKNTFAVVSNQRRNCDNEIGGSHSNVGI